MPWFIVTKSTIATLSIWTLIRIGQERDTKQNSNYDRFLEYMASTSVKKKRETQKIYMNIDDIDYESKKFSVVAFCISDVVGSESSSWLLCERNLGCLFSLFWSLLSVVVKVDNRLGQLHRLQLAGYPILFSGDLAVAILGSAYGKVTGILFLQPTLVILE
jgi:hypothetical protein